MVLRYADSLQLEISEGCRMRELFTSNVNFSLTFLSSCLPSFHLLLGNIILQKKKWTVKRDDVNFCFRFQPHPCSFSTDASALLSHL